MYQEAMDAWPAGSAEVMVPTRYGSTHVVSAGPEERPVVVVLHGMGVPAPFMGATLEPSFLASHRVIAPDTIGDVGKSELDDLKSRPRTGADYAGWLDDVLGGLIAHDRDVDLIGTSYGAWIALHYGCAHPERVDRIALLNPLGIAPWSVLVALMGRIILLGVRLTRDPDSGARWAFRDQEDLAEAAAPWMRLTMKCRHVLGLPRPIPASTLRMLQIPTLVVLGQRDPVLGAPRRLVNRARLLPQMRLEVVGGGHALSVEAPEAVDTLLDDFLTKRSALGSHGR
jgi:pimeloyl-ACP methyl ester carboxylesterase